MEVYIVCYTLLDGKKQFENSVWQIWSQVFKIHIKLWILKWEWNRIAIVYFSVVLWSGVIFSQSFVFLLPKSVVCSWGVQDQHSWCGLPKVVCFSRGSRSLLWCVVFVIWFWLHSGLLSGYWGLDVALGVRVNQYKSVCVILSFPDLTYICFKFFLLTVDKRLNRKNIRLIFWKSTKTTLWLCFP